MLELHKKVNPRDTIVGWFSTGKGIVSSDALIQEFYSNEFPNSIHLVVDVDLPLDTPTFQAFSVKECRSVLSLHPNAAQHMCSATEGAPSRSR